VRVFAIRHQAEEIDHVDERTFKPVQCSRRIAAAASASEVGISPAHAMTRVRLSPASCWPSPYTDTFGAVLDRVFHVRYCRCVALSATITLT